MQSHARLALILVIVLTLTLVGCGKRAATSEPAAPPTAASPTATPQPMPSTATLPPPTPATAEGAAYPLPTPDMVEPAAAYPGATPSTAAVTLAWRADGKIGPGEYTNEQSLDKMAIWWVTDAQYLYMAVQGPTTGWVAVGLDPANRMQGANFIMGAVVDGEALVWDAFGMAPVGPNHPQDTELGGTMDVVAFGGQEKDGQTLFEFQIPLDSGDQYDKPLALGGTYPAIVAFGNEDGFTTPHAYRGAVEIAIKTAP